MKVKYIGATDISLENGKIYDVISIECGSYRIVDDTEEDYLFSPEEFEIVSDDDRKHLEEKDSTLHIYAKEN